MSELGDLIRKGAEMIPQGFGGYFTIDYGRIQVCACVQGQVMVANGFPVVNLIDPDNVGRMNAKANDPDIYMHYAGAMVQFNRVRIHECPEPACMSYSHHIHDNGGQMIVHLNDDHHWTSLQIADWVDKVMKERGHE